MKLLRKLFNFFVKKIKKLPTMSLCYPKIKIENITHKPYFIVGNMIVSRGKVTEKLYIDELKNKINYYKNLFSHDDWAIIQYNLGGLESLQLCGNYQIISIDFENMNINVRSRSDLKEEIWDISDTIINKKFLNLDKQSILDLGIFYQSAKNSDILHKKIKKEIQRQIFEQLHVDESDKLYKDTQLENKLRLVK